MTKTFQITDNLTIGGDSPPLLIAGPCVIESEDMIMRHAARIAGIAATVGLPLVFKASYDKANRTSRESFRGPGLPEGLRILNRVKTELGVPMLTDAHSIAEIDAVGKVVDVIQIPAFLCRQTDLLEAAAKTGRTVNVKKGQFLAPDDVVHIIDKIEAAGGKKLMITERGASFGYHRLVVDFVGLAKMREFGYPVVLDATHSVQFPGGAGGKSGGESRYAPTLAYAAAAAGVDGLFVETHEQPEKALSDGPNMIPLDKLEEVLQRFLSIHKARRA